MNISPFTARVGVRLGWVMGLGIAALILVPVLLFAWIANLPEVYPYTLLKSEAGTLGLAVFSLLVVGILFILLWGWFSTGKIVVDSSGMKWEIEGEKGFIRWDQPFSLHRWRSVYESGGTSYDQPSMTLPVIVYRVAQGDSCLTFWYAESWKKIQNFPEGPLAGVMLFHHARKVASTIERIHEQSASYGEQ